MFWQQELFLLSVCQTDRQRALTSFSDVICEMSERVIGKVILLFLIQYFVYAITRSIGIGHLLRTNSASSSHYSFYHASDIRCN